jgi:hypothetical protein
MPGQRIAATWELPDAPSRLRHTMMIRSTILLIAALALVIGGCTGRTDAPSPSPSGSTPARTGIAGTATAGPVCPVERVPPDPSCAPRPVADAVMVIRDRSGAEIARGHTGTDGSFFIAVAPGVYQIEPQPVQGLMGTAGSQQVTVDAGDGATVDIVYDTGIRGPAVLPS